MGKHIPLRYWISPLLELRILYPESKFQHTSHYFTIVVAKPFHAVIGFLLK